MDSIKLLVDLAMCMVAIFFYCLYKKQSMLPPGPWNLPLVGYLPWINSKAPYLTLAKLSKKFGPIYGLNLGHIYTVVITDVKLMRKILTKDQTALRPALFLFNCMSGFRGILVSQGELHKDQRKFLKKFLIAVGASRSSPNRSRLQSYVTNQSLELLQHVEGKGERLVFCPAELLTHNVASVISSIVLDVSWSRDDKNWKNLLHCLEEIPRTVSCAGPLNFFPFLRFLPRYKKNLNVLKASVDALLIAFKPLIDKKKQTLQDGDSSTNVIETFLSERSKCKLESKKFYTDLQLGYLINDLFVAGVETTVVSLSWYLLYMAVYQDAQSKVRQELVDVLGEEEPSLDHLPLLPYFEATMVEVARIRSALPLGVPHCAAEDVIVGKYNIPKGAMIVSLLWAVHMDASVWVDPEAFRPERFINVEGIFFKPESFVPFLIGKRRCLGEELAKMIMVTFIANILKCFKVECEDSVDLTGNCGMTLVPKPHNIKFTKL